MSKRYTKKINIRVPEEVHNLLVEIASLQGKTLSTCIRDNLAWIVARYREARDNE